jgi:hypothetical protein
MKPHKHAALMAEYAKDAAETETPWERWGYRDKSGFLQMSLFKHPEWRIDFSYHRKPRTISINGHEVPEPMRVAPEIGDIYFCPEAAEAASLAIASLFKP